MARRSERTLRTALAQRLELFEPQLSLLGEEVPLPNAQGTRGFVDILARDENGYYVVIELKRSDSTAREALHELVKYTELLQHERGLRGDRLRGILVSTHWDELRVPFAAAVRSFPFDLRGFHLRVDADGEISGAERVVPVAEPSPAGLSLVHRAYVFADERQRDALFPPLAVALAEQGCPDNVGIHLDNGHPRWPGDRHMLYLVIGRASAEEYAAEASRTEESPVDPTDLGFPIESRAIQKVPFGSFRGITEIQVGWAEKFVGLVDGKYGWTISSVVRSGRFAEQSSLVGDHELIADVRDFEGGNITTYRRRVRPDIRGALDSLISETAGWLERIPTWRDGLAWWLREHADAREITVVIYVPYDLPAAFADMRDGGNPSGPRLAAYVGEPGTGDMLAGELTWDGTIDSPVDEAFFDAYRSVFSYNMWRDATADASFTSGLGLSYSLFDKGRGGLVRLVELDQGEPGLRPHDDLVITHEVQLRWNGVRYLPEFCEARKSEIEALAAMVKTQVVYSFDEMYWNKHAEEDST
ncbi:MAG: hypothetical protein QOD83_4311 [Solirubrobacteraceae bacterium]|nr:hypothetical protein [Solirubrobacteraceae bacterium]